MKKKKILLILYLISVLITCFACSKNVEEPKIEQKSQQVKTTQQVELNKQPTNATSEEVVGETSENNREEFFFEVEDSISEEQAIELTDDELAKRVQEFEWTKNVNQIILVIGTNQSRARFLFLEKKDDIFEVKFTTLAWVGENGIGKTKEGDGKTPEGIYILSHPFGRKENPGCQMPYTKLDDSWYWVEDVKSNYYNQMVTTNEVEIDWEEADQLNTSGYSYNYALAIDYNIERIPGVGSAIFLHCTHNSATKGCIAIEEEFMMKTLEMVKEGAVIAIFAEEDVMY